MRTDHNAEARAAARFAGHGPDYATHAEIRRHRQHVATAARCEESVMASGDRDENMISTDGGKTWQPCPGCPDCED